MHAWKATRIVCLVCLLSIRRRGKQKPRFIVLHWTRHTTHVGQLDVKPFAMHSDGSHSKSRIVFLLIPIGKTNAETNSMEQSRCWEANSTLSDSRNYQSFMEPSFISVFTRDHYRSLPWAVISNFIPLHAMETHGRRGGIAPTHT
jgi:hypothetical protein